MSALFTLFIITYIRWPRLDQAHHPRLQTCSTMIASVKVNGREHMLFIALIHPLWF